MIKVYCIRFKKSSRESNFLCKNAAQIHISMFPSRFASALEEKSLGLRG
jgi:hypothetical protein